MERKDAIIIATLCVAFFLLFFVRYQSIPDPCTWQVCPDAGGGEGWSSLIAATPNFYIPAGCFFGVAGEICHEARLNIAWLIMDILIFSIIIAGLLIIRRRT